MIPSKKSQYQREEWIEEFWIVLYEEWQKIVEEDDVRFRPLCILMLIIQKFYNNEN